MTRPTDQQSSGRICTGGHEADLDHDPDLEEKPRIPPTAPSGAIVDLNENRDPHPSDKGSAKPKPDLLTKPTVASRSVKKKKTKSTRTKLKAPDSEVEDATKSRVTATKDTIEQAYYRKVLSEILLHDPVLAIIQVRQIGDLTGPVSSPQSATDRLIAVKILMNLLREAGLVAGDFDPNSLFDMDLSAIQSATRDLFSALKTLVGERSQIPDPGYQTGSSHYASATSEPDTDSSRGVQRMSLGPSGAKLLRTRTKKQDPRPSGPRSLARSPDLRKSHGITVDPTTPTTNTSGSSNKLDEYFQMAMNRFLKEQSFTPAKLTNNPKYLGAQDVDMESVGTPDQHSWQYDPDDLGIPSSARRTTIPAAVASAAIGQGGSSVIQRVRISAISDLKEFAGKDLDEDRARSWISKVKSAFQRDQATEEEKCLTFADLMIGPAKNWYGQLSRSTKTKWSDLLDSFQTQYCGLEMSVAWQYYHARKRSEETPLGYLYRLNVAALQAKLKIKDGGPKARRAHVDHFIETLGDPELADRLTLLRLSDVDDLEEILRARERAKSRQRRSAYGSKYRQKTPASTPTAPARAVVRAIQTHDPSSESEGVSGSDGSDSEGDLRRIYLAAADDPAITTGGEPHPPDKARSRPPTQDRSRNPDHWTSSDRNRPDQSRCSHCGSRKHTDLDCWRRLTCEKCGKRGHPTDRCLYVCRGCGKVHEAGECVMEEFYNQIRKWYDPTRHAGMFPEKVEKMLN